MVKNPEIIRKEIKDKRAGVIIIKYCYKHDHTILHRDDGAAYIVKTKNGKTIRKEWYKHGVVHRDNGPAKIELFQSYDKSWVCDIEYFQNGKMYRKDGYPSSIRIRNDYIRHLYYKHNMIHNTNGACDIEYYVDGRISSEYGVLGMWLDEDKFKELKQELFLRDTPMGKILGTPILDKIKFGRPHCLVRYFRDNR